MEALCDGDSVNLGLQRSFISSVTLMHVCSSLHAPPRGAYGIAWRSHWTTKKHILLAKPQAFLQSDVLFLRSWTSTWCLAHEYSSVLYISMQSRDNENDDGVQETCENNTVSYLALYTVQYRGMILECYFQRWFTIWALQNKCTYISLAFISNSVFTLVIRVL